MRLPFNQAQTAKRNALAAVAICLGLLVGCGQRGPLYLPDETAEQQRERRQKASIDPVVTPVRNTPAQTR